MELNQMAKKYTKIVVTYLATVQLHDFVYMHVLDICTIESFRATHYFPLMQFQFEMDIVL